MIKVKKFVKLKGNSKRYEITFEKNGKTYARKFGAAGMSDYTIHKDKERRERYISRHKKDLRTKDPMRPGYLSMYILWNKPSLNASLSDYKHRLNVYNKTGKFPTGISGSKKLSFGTVNIPFEQTSMNILPGDIQNLIRDTTGARIIQDATKKYDPKRSLFEALKIKGLETYKDAAKRTKNPRENINFVNKLWTNLDPINVFTSKWLTRASKVLTKSDFDFKNRNFWWQVIWNQLITMHEIEEEIGDPSEELDPIEYFNYEKCQEAIMVILNRTGYPITINDIDERWAWNASMWWKNKRTNSFGMKNAAQIKDILADKVRWDPAQIILEYAAAPELQKLARGYLARKFTKSKRYLKMVLLAINIDFYNSIRRSMGSNFNPEQYAIEQMTPDSGEPWLALNPLKHDTTFLLKKMSSILTKKDLSDDMLWYNIISYVLDEIVTLDPDNIQYRGQQGVNVEQSADYTLELLNKMGYPYGPGDDLYEWYNNALVWLEEQTTPELNFGKKYQAPDNVVNKKMYESIKSKIQRSIKGRRWGAYDSGRLVREYKSKGGKYTGSKGKSNLSRWYKEKWVDACAWSKRKPCGRKTKKSIAYCRPSKKVDSKTPKLVQKLTKAQINSRCARKKKTPMKRITKFGKAEPDVDVGNGWVIHCNHINGIGPHATLRQKQLAGPTPETDHAFRYGIKYRGGAPEFWAGGDFAKSGTGLPNVLGQKLLMDYFYNNCGGQNPRMLPPKSPAHYSYNKFGDKKKLRQDMYNDIILGPSNDMRDNVTNALIKRCPGALTPRLDNKECSKRMTELILSIYFTMIKDKSIKLNTKRKREINIKIRSRSKVYGAPSMLNLRKKYLIDELLIGLQGGYFGKVFKGELSNYILESIIT